MGAKVVRLYNNSKADDLVVKIKDGIHHISEAENTKEHWQVKVGEWLVALKKEVGHGEWIPRLKEIEISQSRAKEFMSYARGTRTVEQDRSRVREAVKETRAKSPLRNGDLPDPSAWTDEEIEAEMGPIATEAEIIAMDMRGLANFALRIKNVKVADGDFTAADRRLIKSVITAWTEVLRKIGE